MERIPIFTNWLKDEAFLAEKARCKAVFRVACPIFRSRTAGIASRSAPGLRTMRTKNRTRVCGLLGRSQTRRRLITMSELLGETWRGSKSSNSRETVRHEARRSRDNRTESAKRAQWDSATPCSKG